MSIPPDVCRKPSITTRRKAIGLLRRITTALLVLAPTAIVAPTPAYAAVTSVRGFARITNTMSHTVPAPYASNSAGGAVQHVRNSVGNYRVRFVGLGAAANALGNGGVAHAAPFGYYLGMCTVGGWSVASSDLDVTVNCFDDAGARDDMMFVVNFVAGSGTGTEDYSYAWANQPSAASYTPAAFHRWDADGGTAQVQRDGTGRYRVYLPASTDRSNTTSFYQVTAYTSSPVHCKPNAIVGTIGWVGVRCRDHAGTYVDSRFTITFATDPLRGAHFGGWPPAWGAAYVSVNTAGVPSVSWSDTFLDAPATVVRFGPGQYRVSFGLPDFYAYHAVATSQGLNDRRCSVTRFDASWNFVDVFCHSAAGVPADSNFYVGTST